MEAEVATGRLVEVPLAGLNLVRNLRAVWRRGRSLAAPAATLLAIASRP